MRTLLIWLSKIGLLWMGITALINGSVIFGLILLLFGCLWPTSKKEVEQMNKEEDDDEGEEVIVEKPDESD